VKEEKKKVEEGRTWEKEGKGGSQERNELKEGDDGTQVEERTKDGKRNKVEKGREMGAA